MFEQYKSNSGPSDIASCRRCSWFRCSWSGGCCSFILGAVNKTKQGELLCSSHNRLQQPSNIAALGVARTMVVRSVLNRKVAYFLTMTMIMVHGKLKPPAPTRIADPYATRIADPSASCPGFQVHVLVLCCSGDPPAIQMQTGHMPIITMPSTSILECRQKKTQHNYKPSCQTTLVDLDCM